LDAKGRQQAIDIGAAIQRSGFRFTQVFSSEWCRCKETTDLMKLDKWRIFPGLNSFFQGHVDKQDTLEMLSLKLEALTKGVTLMVTHQVIINAVTGASVGSGEFVAYNTDTKMRKVFRLD
jgi:broad specificity phosphatase PhoE